ncbi:MAG: C13 family peptidase [Candidatus Hodarchaeota archaeon]
MRWKIIIPIIAMALVAVLVIALLLMFLPRPPGLGPAERKAIILCSANDFYDSEVEEDYGDSNDGNFELSQGNWTFTGVNCIGFHFPGVGNYTPLGSIAIQPDGTELIKANYTYNWTDFYPLVEYAMYNITVSGFIQNISSFQGLGARIGLQWLNSSDQIVRTDWSNYYNTTYNNWFSLNTVGFCNNYTNREITNLSLILSFEGNFGVGGVTEHMFYDDVIIDRVVSVNNTNPTDPPPPPSTKKDSDGFPAQALQVYWVLKNHGYTDENIFLMLYYKNDVDGIIDNNAFDAYKNDLIHGTEPAIIDVANDSVTAVRFKQELNVSVSGSFASKVKSNDYFIIFMTDHGSNNVLGDGNATFHFEADNSWISEFEFYNLVKNIKCARMMINVDCCFSGNFLNENQNIGSSWYNIPNSIMISAASNVFSWYWINNQNPDGFAGSFFFHVFWDLLDQNQTINAAFTNALLFSPALPPPPRTVQMIQNPLMYDNMGINTTLSFNSVPPL